MTALDTHRYMAWQNFQTVDQYCDFYEADALQADLLTHKYEVWNGEWALATDVCAHWLGGLNDANTQNQQPCNPVACPKSYLEDPDLAKKCDFDRTAEWVTPYGTWNQTWVGTNKGMCWDDSLYFNHTQVKAIAKCVLDTNNRHYNASFMWTTRNEIEARWSYL